MSALTNYRSTNVAQHYRENVDPVYTCKSYASQAASSAAQSEQSALKSERFAKMSREYYDKLTDAEIGSYWKIINNDTLHLNSMGKGIKVAREAYIDDVAVKSSLNTHTENIHQLDQTTSRNTERINAVNRTVEQNTASIADNKSDIESNTQRIAALESDSGGGDTFDDGIKVPLVNGTNHLITTGIDSGLQWEHDKGSSLVITPQSPYASGNTGYRKNSFGSISPKYLFGDNEVLEVYTRSYGSSSTYYVKVVFAKEVASSTLTFMFDDLEIELKSTDSKTFMLEGASETSTIRALFDRAESNRDTIRMSVGTNNAFNVALNGETTNHALSVKSDGIYHKGDKLLTVSSTPSSSDRITNGDNEVIALADKTTFSKPIKLTPINASDFPTEGVNIFSLDGDVAAITSGNNKAAVSIDPTWAVQMYLKGDKYERGTYCNIYDGQVSFPMFSSKGNVTPLTITDEKTSFGKPIEVKTGDAGGLLFDKSKGMSIEPLSNHANIESGISFSDYGSDYCSTGASGLKSLVALGSGDAANTHYLIMALRDADNSNMNTLILAPTKTTFSKPIEAPNITALEEKQAALESTIALLSSELEMMRSRL